MKTAAPKRGAGADPVRLAALQALVHFEKSPGAAERLAARFTRPGFDARDRAFFRELLYGTLRWQARLDDAYGRFLREPAGRLFPEARAALRLGAYQLLFLDRVPAHGAVSTAVNLLQGKGRKGAKGLVNAVLRKVAEASFAPPEEIEARLAVWESHPRWLVQRWIKALGPERARARCEANNQEAPLTLRANTARTRVEELRERLAGEGVPTEPGMLDPDCLRVAAAGGERPSRLTETASFAEGLFQVQDESASLAARFAGTAPGERVLDACAAPGGKAAALAWAAGAEGLIVAADARLPRLARLAGNCARIAPGVQVVGMDIESPSFTGVFDAVMVDAPCSSLGVLRRHPDARWRLKEEDIARQAERQHALLQGAAGAVRPGGRLIYAVCTNEPEETEEVVRGFQAPGFTPLQMAAALPEGARRHVGADGALRICPEESFGLDGFFAAAWKREGAPR